MLVKIVTGCVRFLYKTVCGSMQCAGGLCNTQTATLLGLLTLAAQLLLMLVYPHLDHPEGSAQEMGDVLYYGKQSLGIRYAEYAKMAAYKLVLKPNVSTDVAECDGSSYKLHDVGGLPVRQAGLYQTLGNTNVHGLGAYLDHRVASRPLVRVLAVGLHPGPGDQVYCNYRCARPGAVFCSTPAHGVILLSGNHSDYPPDFRRESLMTVLSLACAVSADDRPVEVSLTLTRCGYSHNTIAVLPLAVPGEVVAPPGDVGVCVLPIRQSQLDSQGLSMERVALWLEYLRALGAHQVHLYHSDLGEDILTMLQYYRNETFSVLTMHNWTTVDTRQQHVVSEEAAINHCLYSQTLAYDFILITPIHYWPSFGGAHKNLKQLVRSEDFRNKVHGSGGFRIRSPDNRPAMLVKPRLVLATAAYHFIALTSEPTFRLMKSSDLEMVITQDRRTSQPFNVLEQKLETLVHRKTGLEQIK